MNYVFDKIFLCEKVILKEGRFYQFAIKFPKNSIINFTCGISS
jgi:hypothetical protein